jgi:hypothetical protein
MCETFPPNQQEDCNIPRASIKVGWENRLPYKAHSNGWTQISLNYNFQDEAITLTAKEVIAPSARLILVGGGRLPPSPPAEKGTARQDQAGKSSTGEGERGQHHPEPLTA